MNIEAAMAVWMSTISCHVAIQTTELCYTHHLPCSVEWLVLDEADKLFESGPDETSFREQVRS